MSKEYESAGVSLEAGYESVRRIKKHIASTSRPGVMGNIGSFGGMFDLASLGYKEPVLVSGTDGVGTKLKLAFMMDKHDTIGQDVVAMCVNDVLSQGARPLFFLDYIAVGKNFPEKIEAIVKGVADGCRLADCGLIGGDPAEMPDMYDIDDYDVAGFTVGCVEKSKMIDGSKTKAGDVVIGLKSSGVHSNGFSLVRKIIFKDHNLDLNEKYTLSRTLGEALLEPTRIYVRPVVAVLDEVDVHGVAHITGGGFYENMPRCLKEGLGIKINKGSWDIPEIFGFLQEIGNISEHDMYNVFNMGIGMILVVDEKDIEKTMEILKDNGENPSVIGTVTDNEGIVIE